MAPRVEHQIQCPHCGIWISVTGQGSKTVVKGTRVVPPKPPKPQVGLKDILGEHFDAYWVVSSAFGPGKNFAPMKSAAAYMVHIAKGVTDDQIRAAAHLQVRLTSEQKYLPQLVKWLEGQDFTAPQPKGTTNESSPSSRFSGRRTADEIDPSEY